MPFVLENSLSVQFNHIEFHNKENFICSHCIKWKRIEKYFTFSVLVKTGDWKLIGKECLSSKSTLNKMLGMKLGRNYCLISDVALPFQIMHATGFCYQLNSFISNKACVVNIIISSNCEESFVMLQIKSLFLYTLNESFCLNNDEVQES